MQSGVEVKNALRARDLGLETLPDEILEKVLRFAIEVPPDGEEDEEDEEGNAPERRAELLRAVPVVCKKLLATLRRLKMHVGQVHTGNAEAVRQQANERTGASVGSRHVYTLGRWSYGRVGLGGVPSATHARHE